MFRLNCDHFVPLATELPLDKRILDPILRTKEGVERRFESCCDHVCDVCYQHATERVVSLSTSVVQQQTLQGLDSTWAQESTVTATSRLVIVQYCLEGISSNMKQMFT